MATVTSQRMGVCSDCQSMAPVRSDSRDGFVMDRHRICNLEVGEWCIGAGTIPEVLINTAFEKMGKEITAMTDEFLAVTWRALGVTDWTNDEMYDPEGVTMNEWADAILHEMELRGLPMTS